MASVFSIRILLFLCIYCSWMLIIHARSNLPFTNDNNHENTLLGDKYTESSSKLDSNLLDDPLSSSFLSNSKRRNVIMPRICYFARISGTGGHQKLCLPYNDHKRS